LLELNVIADGYMYLAKQPGSLRSRATIQRTSRSWRSTPRSRMHVSLRGILIEHLTKSERYDLLITDDTWIRPMDYSCARNAELRLRIQIILITQ